MKTNLKSFLLFSFSAIVLSACSEEEEPKGPSGPVYTELKTYSSITLGSQVNAALGSFYSVSEDSIYFTAGANLNTSKIDFIFYYDTQNTDTFVIASPKDPIFGLPDDQVPHKSVKGWAIKNNTTFLKLSIDGNTFNGLKNDSLLQNDLDSNVVETNIPVLKVGDVVGFKTELGKLGIYHVKAINNTSSTTRSITFDVKVQQ